MIHAWVGYRKNGGRNDLLIRCAKFHGRRCFFGARGLGECSDDIDLDRIIPGSRGGEYTVENCFLACSRHNRQRGDRSIEAYLAEGPTG